MQIHLEEKIQLNQIEWYKKCILYISKQLLCRWPIKKEVLEGGVARVWGAVGRNRFQPLLLSISGMDSLVAIIEMARLDARSLIYSSCQFHL